MINLVLNDEDKREKRQKFIFFSQIILEIKKISLIFFFFFKLYTIFF